MTIYRSTFAREMSSETDMNPGHHCFVFCPCIMQPCYMTMDISAVAYPGILFGAGVQKIQLRTEDRENGDLGAVAP